jgi:hypothetical protein
MRESGSAIESECNNNNNAKDPDNNIKDNYLGFKYQ